MTGWGCPNDPPCGHAAAVHDIYDYEDEVPTCCVAPCQCGKRAVRPHRSMTREEYAAQPMERREGGFVVLAGATR